MKNTNKPFKPVNDTIKQVAPQTTGAVNDTTKATELRGKEKIKAVNKLENRSKYPINFDLRILGPLKEVANSKNQDTFDCEAILFQRNSISIKMYPLNLTENH